MIENERDSDRTFKRRFALWLKNNFQMLFNIKKSTREFLMQVKFIVSLLQPIATHKSRAGSFGTLPGPILRKYWTANGEIIIIIIIS